MRWIVALLIVSLLAGCTSDKSDTEPDPIDPNAVDPDTDTTTGQPGGQDTPSGDPPTVEPPAEPVMVSLAVDKTSGVAPLDVSLTVTASHAAAWALFDNGEELQRGDTPPETIDVTLDAGEHVLRFVLDSRPPVEDSVTVIVDPAAVPASRHVFLGKLDAAADTATLHEFAVPERSEGITLVLTYGEDLEDELDFHPSPPAWNLDVALIAPDGTSHAFNQDSFEAATLNDVMAGQWQAEIVPARANIALEYELELIVWGSSYQTATYEGTLQGVNLGWPTPAQTQTPPDSYDVVMPDGTTVVAAFLEWTAPSQQSCDTVSSLVDFDLEGYQGDEEKLSSAHGRACEATSWDGDAAGAWRFDVIPFLVPQSDYVLTIMYG